MRLSRAESGAIGSSGSAGESTCSSCSCSSSPPRFTRSSATTLPVTVTADSGVSAETASLSALGGSSLPSTTCTAPASSRTTTNCTRFWSRIACTQPRTLARAPTLAGRSAVRVLSTDEDLIWAELGEAIRRAARIEVLPPPPFGPAEPGRFQAWRRRASERHLDGELVRLDALELLDRARREQVAETQLQGAQPRGRVVHAHEAARARASGAGPGTWPCAPPPAPRRRSSAPRPPRRQRRRRAPASPSRSSSALSSAASGQGARWIEPGCHHDHTSSHTNGRNGASRRWNVDTAKRSARLTEAAPWDPRRSHSAGP